MSRHKTTAVVLLLSFGTIAYAVDEVEYCREYSLIAKKVMELRQDNISMSGALLLARDYLKDWVDLHELDVSVDEAEEIAAGIVMDAYDKRIKTAERHQQLEVTEFENSYFEECYELRTAKRDE